MECNIDESSGLAKPFNALLISESSLSIFDLLNIYPPTNCRQMCTDLAYLAVDSLLYSNYSAEHVGI